MTTMKQVGSGGKKFLLLDAYDNTIGSVRRTADGKGWTAATTRHDAGLIFSSRGDAVKWVQEEEEERNEDLHDDHSA